MDEFNNRMDAQRDVLRVVNAGRFAEELLGLAQSAIFRWISVNHIDPDGEIASILLRISSKLFCLATVSQEQVTDDYGRLSAEVRSLTANLKEALAKHHSAQ